MHELTKRKLYGSELAAQIEALGAMAVSIANRWQMGWPDLVAPLLKAGKYLDALKSQLETELEILANEADQRHLARHEILRMYEIKESPPTMD